MVLGLRSGLQLRRLEPKEELELDSLLELELEQDEMAAPQLLESQWEQLPELQELVELWHHLDNHQKILVP